MKFPPSSLFLFILFFTATIASATENKEIDYLLSYLADSGCSFIRNGEEYEAKEARNHLKMKYNYAKGRIKTAEDFIDKIASKSSLSRKPYTVHCGEVQTPSKEWLGKALAAHRGF